MREGDPRRYSPRDIELAQAALRQLPVGVPLPVVVNAEGEILVGGLFVGAYASGAGMMSGATFGRVAGNAASAAAMAREDRYHRCQ